MSALRRFLAGNAAAALFLASLPVGEAMATETSGAALVSVDRDADRLAVAAAMLRDSAARCVRHQAELLDGIQALPAPGGGEADPAEGPSRLAKGVEEAAGLRRARLSLYLVDDPMEEAREAIEASRPVPKDVYADMACHVAVRNACIQWSGRSLDLLRDAYRGKPGPGTDAALAKAREAAAADSATLKGLMRDGGPAPSNIQGMATFPR